jgi:hypothetical protein
MEQSPTKPGDETLNEYHRPSPYTSHRKKLYSSSQKYSAKKVTDDVKIQKFETGVSGREEVVTAPAPLEQSFNGFMAQRRKLLAKLTSNIPN